MSCTGAGTVSMVTAVAAAASHGQSRAALKLARDIGARDSEADALNSIGELLTRTSHTALARDHHNQALAIARHIPFPSKRHAPWKESETAAFPTGTPAKPPPTLEIFPA